MTYTLYRQTFLAASLGITPDYTDADNNHYVKLGVFTDEATATRRQLAAERQGFVTMLITEE